MTISSDIIGDPPGSGHALDTFQRTARTVPAYRAFLADIGVDPAAIVTPADFATLPAVTKANYLRCYPRMSLLRRGEIATAGTWWASSGSSGKPTYWPHDVESLAESVELYDRMFRHGFASHQRSTLLVIGFAMGVWIGGTYTYRAALELRRRGHRLSVIAPGLDIDAILANIADLGPDYDQVVLAGYPPFLQDVLDRADAAVLQQDLRFLAAGESISEPWRDHLLHRIGRPGEPERVCLIYGTADAGIMGHETATTIAVRRLAATDPRLAAELFGDGDVLPTFVEYDPQLRYTEVDADGHFLFTIDGALPLIRYRINDAGRILTTAQVGAALARCGHRLPVRTTVFGAAFLALDGRTDVAASFYATKLYPDSIRSALADPALHGALTGKFVVSTRHGAAFEQTLDLRVELRENVSATPGFADMVRDRVAAALERTNIEYRRLRETLGPAADPEVTVSSYGSDEFHYTTKHSYLGGDR